MFVRNGVNNTAAKVHQECSSGNLFEQELLVRAGTTSQMPEINTTVYL